MPARASTRFSKSARRCGRTPDFSGRGPSAPMPYASLREFIARLEGAGRLVRVTAPVSPCLEMTEIQTRLLAEGGPAVLFENVVHPGSLHPSGAMPVLVNLFGTVE